MFGPFFNSQGPVVKKATLPATYYTTSVFPKILLHILLQVKKWLELGSRIHCITTMWLLTKESPKKDYCAHNGIHLIENSPFSPSLNLLLDIYDSFPEIKTAFKYFFKDPTPCQNCPWPYLLKPARNTFRNWDEVAMMYRMGRKLVWENVTVILKWQANHEKYRTN